MTLAVFIVVSHAWIWEGAVNVFRIIVISDVDRFTVEQAGTATRVYAQLPVDWTGESVSTCARAFLSASGRDETGPAFAHTVSRTLLTVSRALECTRQAIFIAGVFFTIGMSAGV